MQDVGSQSRDIPVFYLLELTYPSIDNVSFGGVPLDIDTGSRTYFYVSVADGIGIPLLIRLRNVYDWESDVFRGCWQQLCAMSSGSQNYADKGSILDGANVSLNTSMVSIPMPNDLRECNNFGDNHVDSSRDMGRS
ncbi:hypothetical protein BBOV_II006490 [Babesia bovis T2Bo]|uniref:Uncharacterized protein n=1 Tax=Babesia bovis TaxID=5865 RepID=A7AUI8_BABBO|nr:hypothetical protein BBOV_II006490 [Babesia bovis T2Bo]EDO06599.1 hypothetical protein BBOV_II006490 [Babesia bovis T2Bo]|eukprot:XP_001610167.1 hypothetical protein [Babesia bovis T2Bo]